MIPAPTVDCVRGATDLRELVEELGFDINRQSKALCPFHQEKTPSFTVYDDGHYKCFGCGEAGDVFSFTVKHLGVTFPEAVALLCERAGIDIPTNRVPKVKWSRQPSSLPRESRDQEPAFPASEASRVWQLAYDRARCDDAVEFDRPVYEYLDERGLMPAWNERLFGVLSSDMALPPSIAWWPRESYRVVCPLFDLAGALVCIQARAIEHKDKKTLFPKGAVRGPKLFANVHGREVLQGQGEFDAVVVGEGLTDFLALGAAVPHMPVMCVPGVGSAAKVIGEWAREIRLILAFDNDNAGERATESAEKEAWANGASRVICVDWRHANDAAEIAKRDGVDALTDLLDEGVTK